MTRMLGKLPPRRDRRTLKLGRYTKKLAPAPRECDRTAKVTNLGMMFNDTVGDCTCAAVGHVIQVWTANQGAQYVVPDTSILELYEDVSGYNPQDPSSDQGAVEIDVLNYWRKHPLVGHSLLAYASIKPQATEEIRQAVYYFGAAYVGVALPLTAQNQSGTWTVTSLKGDGAPGSWGGHAVPIVAYDQHTVTFITWGSYQKASWNWLWAYLDECYALLGLDWLGTSGKTPDGFDLATLRMDLAEVSV